MAEATEPAAAAVAPVTTDNAPVDDGFTDSATPTVSNKPDTTEESTDKTDADDKSNKAETDESDTTKSDEEEDDSKDDKSLDEKERNRQGYEQRKQQALEDKENTEGAQGEASITPEDFLGQLEQEIATELGQIEDTQEQRVQSIEARQYLSEAKVATNQLVMEHSRVQGEIDMFNPEKPDYNPEAYEYFVNEYQAAHTTTDRNGVIWPKQSLYQFMKSAAGLLGTVSQKSALKGQQAEAKMRGRAEVPSGAGERAKSSDDIDDGFGPMPPKR